MKHWWGKLFLLVGLGISFVNNHPIAAVEAKRKAKPSSAPTYIVFENNRQIFIMPGAGGSARALTRGQRDRAPILSDDRKAIAFARLSSHKPFSTLDVSYDLMLMNLQGKMLRKISNSQSFGWIDTTFYRFSPDSQDLLIWPGYRGGYADYQINMLRGKNQPSGKIIFRELPSPNDVNRQPSFSKRNDRIVFATGDAQEGDPFFLLDIGIIKNDGSGFKMLTKTQRDSQPQFSPDGNKIVFVSTRDGNAEIYMMNSDGTEQTRLTNSLSNEEFPSFSPDGKQILFVSRSGRMIDKNVDAEIWLMSSDGTHLKQLTSSKGENYSAAWSPDGKQICFVSKRDAFEAVYTMNADGSGQRLRAAGRTPDWH